MNILKYASIFLIFVLSTRVFGQHTAYTPVTPVSGVLTPPLKESPQINGPNVFGVRPGSPILYFIPVSGKRPLVFTVTYLPVGLKLAAATGRITGVLNTPGKYKLTLTATNTLGKSLKNFTIVVGEDIALTPPMGWNSYNVYGEGVDRDKALHAANAMVKFHLNDHGWTYINCDDGWQGTRDPKTLALQPDPQRFSNMKAYVDEIHALGLKAGLYSSPWVKTYGDRMGGSSQNADGTHDSTWNKNAPHNQKKLPFAIGKYTFTTQDAKQFAAWGADYLKYDWGPVEGPETKEMYNALRATGRDIVFSLSNNHTMSLLKNIADVAPYAEAWRTTTDINDTWKRVSDLGFKEDQWAPYSKPGHFIDPDMLVVGYVGWRGTPHPTKLTMDEQYSHISLWSLLSAPLLLGCDLDKLDAFTLNLLTNDEVLAIDQDELGRQATHVYAKDSLDVYRKPLANGSIAVGLFNRSQAKTIVKVTWAQLGLQGKQAVRDIWRQKDVDVKDDEFAAEVASHGVILIKISPVER